MDARDRLALAPMAGLTGGAFRKLIRWIGGCGAVYTEFVSAAALTRHSGKSYKLLRFDEAERPVICQIFGANAGEMAESARIVESLGADGVDINAGCPVPKVVKQNAGAALLANPGLCKEIFGAVVKAVNIPVSLKMRAGVCDPASGIVVARIAEECGFKLVTLHARTARQAYEGTADWDLITQLKASVSIPVFGNGDVTTAEQALELLLRTGADGVMIGRGAVANPAIFLETAARLEGRDVASPPRELVMRKYLELLEGDDDERDALNHFKQFVAYFTKGMHGGAEFRRRVNMSHELAGVLPLLADN